MRIIRFVETSGIFPRGDVGNSTKMLLSIAINYNYSFIFQKIMTSLQIIRSKKTKIADEYNGQVKYVVLDILANKTLVLFFCLEQHTYLLKLETSVMCSLIFDRETRKTNTPIQTFHYNHSFVI